MRVQRRFMSASTKMYLKHKSSAFVQHLVLLSMDPLWLERNLLKGLNNSLRAARRGKSNFKTYIYFSWISLAGYRRHRYLCTSAPNHSLSADLCVLLSARVEQITPVAFSSALVRTRYTRLGRQSCHSPKSQGDLRCFNSCGYQLPPKPRGHANSRQSHCCSRRTARHPIYFDSEEPIDIDCRSCGPI